MQPPKCEEDKDDAPNIWPFFIELLFLRNAQSERWRWPSTPPISAPNPFFAMKTIVYFAIAALTLCTSIQCSRAQEGDLFPSHMIKPADLAKNLTDSSARHPTIYNIGPRYNIPGAIKIGPISDDEPMANFQKVLATLPKDQNIVVYCGCCPYANCPNVRPAAALLEKMQFTNYLVLDMPHNIQTDWTDKGYPRE